MTYLTGDVPVGVYSSSSLANMGIGHGAIDAGGGYTYFNPQTGHEFSAVLGFTYNFINQSTQYQNGVDMHLDWGASQFLTQQVQVGVVGYVYKDVGCDSGSGDRRKSWASATLAFSPAAAAAPPTTPKRPMFTKWRSHSRPAYKNNSECGAADLNSRLGQPTLF